MTAAAPIRPTASRRRRTALFAVLAGLALIALACGSSKPSTATAADDSTSTSTTASSSTTADGSGSSSSTTTASGSASGASVSVGTTSLGPVIVDDKGFTLFLFE